MPPLRLEELGGRRRRLGIIAGLIAHRIGARRLFVKPTQSVKILVKALAMSGQLLTQRGRRMSAQHTCLGIEHAATIAMKVADSPLIADLKLDRQGGTLMEQGLQLRCL
jgi:hypothetical protein